MAPSMVADKSQGICTGGFVVIEKSQAVRIAVLVVGDKSQGIRTAVFVVAEWLLRSLRQYGVARHGPVQGWRQVSRNVHRLFWWLLRSLRQYA